MIIRVLNNIIKLRPTICYTYSKNRGDYEDNNKRNYEYNRKSNNIQPSKYNTR